MRLNLAERSTSRRSAVAALDISQAGMPLRSSSQLLVPGEPRTFTINSRFLSGTFRGFERKTLT
jgi:hypothetical protein